MGTSRLLFEKTGCESTATYIKSAVPEHQTHRKTSLKEMPTMWMQEKKKRCCIVSKPFLLVLWKKSTSRGCCFPNPQISVMRKTSLPMCHLTPETSCRKRGRWKSSTQCQTQHQPLQPALLSVCTGCHMHPCLQNKAATAPSHTRYITFQPKELLRK